MIETAAMVELGWPALFTLLVIATILVIMAFEYAPPDLTMMGALVVLTLSGTLDTGDALQGFANEALLTVAALLVVAEGVRKTGALAYVFQFMAPTSGSVRRAILRTTVPSAALSSVMNNTPIVAILAPMAREGARAAGIAPSKLLIPLAYATTLGGLITLIGTSTNLVVSGLLSQRGASPLGMFELTAVGLPVTIVGIVYLWLAAPKLLPRRDEGGIDANESRAYHFELRIPAGSPLHGLSVEKAGLRALRGAFLAHIYRGGDVMTLIEPEQILRSDDILTFVGNPEHLDTLLDQKKLVRAVEHGYEPEDHSLPLYEAVVATDSSLVGKTLSEADFRSRFQGVVLGIHRRGRRLTEPLGRTPIEGGDLLLVEARTQFDAVAAASGEFYLAAGLGRRLGTPTRKAPIVLGLLLAVLFIAGSGAVPIAIAAFGAAILMVLFKALSSQEARKSVDVSLLMTIGSGLGIARAIEGTGLAKAIGQLIVGRLEVFGAVAVLAGIYLATNILTEVLSNNAAAALMFPIAAAAASALGVDLRPFAIAVAIAASAAFALPTGYQTYLMIMGTGGYQFRDFIRVGLPLNFIVMSIAVPLIAWLWL
jgi:di/tricarboxylate transporter